MAVKGLIYVRMKSGDISWNIDDEGKLLVQTEMLIYESWVSKQGRVLVVLAVNYEL